MVHWMLAMALSLGGVSDDDGGEPRRTPFPYRASVGVRAGFPVTGLSVGVAIARRWRLDLAAGAGYPLPVVAGGGSLSLARGFVLGRAVTLAPGATLDGFRTRFCSAGGCGARHGYVGAGPTLSLHFHIRRVERVWLGIGLGGGVVFAFVRQRMRLAQPHVQAPHLTIGF